MPDVIWYLKITFDRKVAYPNERLFANAIIINPNPYPIFLGSCYWHFTCYPAHTPGTKEVKSIVSRQETIVASSWRLPVPNVPEGQYEVEASFDTWIWDTSANNWMDMGRIVPDRRETFFIIHTPRFRAFVSRSNYNVDRPIVDTIVSTIQRWGFDTHTVGINEIERDEGKVSERIIQEITRSDCVFAIATPRDISSIPALFRTLTWLHNEVSFSFMANKPTLLIADDTVLLDGLIGTDKIPTIKYSASDLNSFILRLNGLMPVIRNILTEESYRRWKQQRIKEIEEIRYQSFMAGMVVQKRLLLDR